MQISESSQAIDHKQLTNDIRQWGQELGFQQIGFTDIDLAEHEEKLFQWLNAQYHGDMHYMERHGSKRSHPAELVPGTLRIISARMNYLPRHSKSTEILNNPQKAFISRYALGRDYHKVIRKRLEELAKKITHMIGPFGYRVFSDSAPVLEKPLAEKASLGWIGKNTILINRRAGSWFFLGEIYTDLPLPIDSRETSHCGSCHACIDVCPTRAIVAPYKLDARRCISYLTIELRTSIPEEFRPLIGNRIYGCDDCQLFCPWNKFARTTDEDDFQPHHRLNDIALIELFNWTEKDFLHYTEGSAIRRIGYECWLRNIAVALGNAPTSYDVVVALQGKEQHPSALVREHVEWALRRHR